MDSPIIDTELETQCRIAWAGRRFDRSYPSNDSITLGREYGALERFFLNLLIYSC